MDMYTSVREGDKGPVLSMAVYYSAFELQFSSMVHIFNSLGHVFSTVEYLASVHGDSPEEHTVTKSTTVRQLA